MFRLALAAFVIFVLSACESSNSRRPVSPEELDRPMRVGVISTLGDTVHGAYIGFTIFNNEFFSANVPEWEVDAFTTNTVLKLLEKRSGFEYSAIKRDALSSKPYSSELERELLAAAKQQAFDRVMVVYGERWDQLPQLTPAYGIFVRNALGLTQGCIYAIFRIRILDVATGKQVDQGLGGDGAVCHSERPPKIPFKNQFSHYSPEEKQAMRTALESTLARSLQYTLERRLELIPKQTAAK